MPTEYDKKIERLKNNKFIALILVFIASVTGAIQVYDSVSGFIKTALSGEAKKPTIRTTYHYVRGYGISLILDGSLDDALQSMVGGKPLVWKNEIYNKLLSLQNEYAITWKGAYEDYISVEPMQSFIPAEEFGKFDYLPSSFQFYKDHVFSFSMDGTITGRYENQGESYINEMFPADLNRGWHINITHSPFDEDSKKGFEDSIKNGRVPAEYIKFSRSLTAQQAKGLFGSEDYFYQGITKHGYPDSFFNAVVSQDFCGGSWSLLVSTPLLGLQVLVIENLTSEAIFLDKLMYKVSTSDGIVEKSKLAYSKQSVAKLGDGILKPDERLIIPLNLVYAYEYDKTTEADHQDWNEPLDVSVEHLTKLTEHLETIVIDGISRNHECQDTNDCKESNLNLSMPKSEFLKGLQLDTVDSSSMYYLASMKMDTVYVNGVQHNIRPTNESSIFVSRGSESGSCPYLFSSEGENLGKILTGRDSKSEEGVYVKRLNGNFSRFTLKELEREISYIKWAKLECRSSSNSKVYIEPDSELLREGNDNYLILRQGDGYDFTFDVDENLKNCKLQMYGYYEIVN
jgi:hypothetical protein